MDEVKDPVVDAVRLIREALDEHSWDELSHEWIVRKLCDAVELLATRSFTVEVDYRKLATEMTARILEGAARKAASQ